jgi:hypothetical protein
MGLKVMKLAQCTHTHQGLSNAIKMHQQFPKCFFYILLLNLQ